MAEDDLRSTMEAAFAKAETEAAPKEEEQPDGVEQPEVEPEEAPEPEEQAPEEKPEEQAPPEKIAAKAPEKPAEKAPDKAPASWSPKAREGWAKLPPDVRAQITKREHETTVALQQSAGARQALTQLNQTLEPYRDGLMRAGVNDPFRAIDTLFKTESTLRYGNVREKAETIANLISNYGVDIQALDTLLSGSVPEDRPENHIDQILQQRLAPFEQYLQQQQFAAQQQQYNQQQQAVQTVQEFSTQAEFINDVRNDMADLLDLAASRGQKLSLQEAYDKACALHPEVSRVMAQRERERKLMGGQQEIARKRTAASSLAGRRGGPIESDQAADLRSAIELAWNSAGS